MTFADALLRVKSDYMPELALETHTNERLYRMLGTRTEIAASYGFLRYTYELDVAKLSSAARLPDYSNYRARDILRVERASLGGRQLRPAPREVARLTRATSLPCQDLARPPLAFSRSLSWARPQPRNPQKMPSQTRHCPPVPP